MNFIEDTIFPHGSDSLGKECNIALKTSPKGSKTTFLPIKLQQSIVQAAMYAASTIIISQSCLDLLFVNTYKCYNNDIQLNINKISIDKVTTNDIPFRMLEKYPR